MTLIDVKAIALDENRDLYATMHDFLFFSEGFASPEGPGRGPASQEAHMVPYAYGTTWAN